MKILLLGAAGFIGTNLTIELAKKTEDEITLVDRSKAFFKPIVSMDLKNVHILEADLTVDMDFDSILKDQEVVYHLVSTTVPTTSNQHISQELVSNVIFSANLFEACIRCGVKKVVFVSSGGTVYGKEVDCPLKEKTATNPISSYGVQKITIEKLLYLYRLTKNAYCDLFKLKMLKRDFDAKPQRAQEKGQAVMLIENMTENKKHIFFCGVPVHKNMGDQAQRYCIRLWCQQNYPDHEILEISTWILMDWSRARSSFLEIGDSER